tara:strand:+ start:323 stop:1585 length:1263 start_codon:yes stop_codon:yes gene_type:complete
MNQSMLVKAINTKDFQILKSDELVIGGYASIEIVDKQNDLITLDALKEAVKKYMAEPRFRNVMTNHSNVQVGEVLKNYRDSTGKLWKSAVDDVGFFVVIKLREDIEKAKEVQRGIKKGTLRSFSIGGQALEKKKRTHQELGEYNEISKLELHEVTICEKGINPEAKFDILKMEKESGTMSERLEKALEELDSLLKDINSEEEVPNEDVMASDGYNTKGEKMDNPEEENEEVLTGTEDELELEGGSTDETKEHAFTPGDTVEDSLKDDLIVVNNGKPTARSPTLAPISGGKMNKSFNDDVTTLDLTPSNIEKAYEQFRAEQMEKIAYSDIKKQFSDRFAQEITEKKEAIAKHNYDAQTEVSDLKKQFADLRDNLTQERDSIIKAQESANALPANFPSDSNDFANMDWGELHNLVHRIERGE